MAGNDQYEPLNPFSTPPPPPPPLNTGGDNSEKKTSLRSVQKSNADKTDENGDKTKTVTPSDA
uniref:Uncharacterized protein n=1 Tax=Panagrolaimus sp. JU765 TaxID=591449 RepID=A0AC34R1J0_9BILA